MLDRLPLTLSPWRAWALTIAALALALLLRWLVAASLPPGFPFITVFPVAILASMLFGTRYGVTAAIAGGAISWYLFIRPVPMLTPGRAAVTAMLLYLFVVGIALAIIDWLQRVNRRLASERERNAALAQTRGLLFDELQHRVSNNLQAVAGLLTLQRRRVSDPQAATALAEASERVALIGRISRRLYGADETAKRLSSFLAALLEDVVEAHGRIDIVRRVDCPDDIALPPGQSLPVALVVAESIANAIEHGLHDRPAAAIRILVERADGRLRIAVIDNGGALPADFALGASDSMGLSIATVLAQQSDGTYTLTGGAETRATLDLPAA